MEWVQPNASGTHPSARFGHSATYLDGKIYVFGGQGANQQFFSDLFIFDPQKDQWSQPVTSGPAPNGREGHTATAASNKHIYFFGGSDAKTMYNDLVAFNTESNRWVQPQSFGRMPTPRERHTATHIDGKIVIFAGHAADQEYLNDLYVYDTSSGEWTMVNPARSPVPRYHHTADLVNNKLIIFGGRSSSGCFGDVHVFDPAHLEWQQPQVTGIHPAGRWGHSTVVVGTKMILFGGWNGTWCFNDLHVLDTETMSWSRLATMGRMPIARAHHISVLGGNKLFLFGGRNGIRRMNDVYSLGLEKLASSQPQPQQSQQPLPSQQQPPQQQQQQQQQQAPAALTQRTAAPVARPDEAKMPSRTKVRKEDFEWLETLGTGSFGRVRFARHLPTDTYWAVKILKKAEILRLKQVEHIISEKTILTSISHPFIVSVLGTFQDPKYLYLVMEYVVGGEFFTHLRRAGRFNNETSRFYAAQIVLVFQYLHSMDIVYRDLKPENLLLDERGSIKITDFGFAKKVEYRTWTLCGTPEYIAPEILLNKGHGKPVDWWALGILVYEMLAGNPPFVDDDPMGIYQKILAGKIEFPRYFDRHAKDLIKKLLTADITKRIGNLKSGVEDIKRHKWFQGLDWTALYEGQIPAPLRIEVRGKNDTTNFEKYPESTEDNTPPVILEDDPFTDF